MRKLFLAMLLSLLCAAPVAMTGCTMLQEQYESLHTMEQAKFDKLLVQVQSTCRIAGREAGKKADQDTRHFVSTLIDVILKQGTKEAFIEVISKVKVQDEYFLYIMPAMSTALDLIEASSGIPFDLDSYLHPRDLAIIRAMLKGVKEGLEQSDSLVIIYEE